MTAPFTWIRFAAIPSLLVIFYITAIDHFTYTPDDTYIYLQYAKNLVAGNGFSFNAGEPTYGFTGPLWLLLIALGGISGIDLYIMAKVADLLLASAAVGVFFRVSYEMMRDVAPALFATVGFSCGAWMLRWTGTGMETSLSVFLLLFAFFHALRNNYLAAIVTTALLSLVRPEGILLACLVVIDMIYNSHDRRAALKKVPRLVIPFAIIVLPWHVAAYYMFGTAIPNTALAKSGPWFDLPAMGEGIIEIAGTVGLSDGVMLTVLIVSVVAFIRRKNGGGMLARETVRIFVMRQNLIPVGFMILLPVLYVVSGANVVSRYLLLVIPFIALSAFAIVYPVLLSGRFSAYALHGVAIVAAAALLQNQIVYWNVVRPGIHAFEIGMQTTFVPFGKWLKSYAERDDQIFTWDIGAIGYYSDRYVVDGSGLVTPSIIPFMKAGYGPDRMMREEMYRFSGATKYVIHRSALREEWAGESLTPVMTMPFQSMRLLHDRIQYITLYKINVPRNTESP